MGNMKTKNRKKEMPSIQNRQIIITEIIKYKHQFVIWNKPFSALILIFHISHFGVAQGTGVSLKFQSLNKLTPPHERSCLEWSFDQVWCCKIEQGTSM